jgi:tRNA (adenine57-N1/adenine58-N1)-methyltransferase catalytic subunit
MSNIQDGDLIFIIYDKRRQWLRKVVSNQKFHSDKGFIEFNELIGKPYGHTYLLNPNNHKISILKPLISDIIFHMKRQSQIIYPEDIGLILYYSNIHAGSKIIEAGAGSGTVTGILSMFSQPGGFINSFDIREVAIKQAIKNLKRMKLEKFASIQFGNICEEVFDFKALDFAMLDLAQPWSAIENISKYLGPKGRICCFSPTIEQVKKNYSILNQSPFSDIIILELLKRNYQVKPNATRPTGRMVGHTGYMLFAKRSSDEDLMIPAECKGFYSPENMGNLVMYCGLQPGVDVLIINTKQSPFMGLITRFMSNINLTVLDYVEENFQEEINKLGKENFDVIIIDNISNKSLIKLVSPNLRAAGTISGIFQYLEQMKSIHDQMAVEKYLKIESFELIKKEIVFESKGSKSLMVQNDYPGFITTGRKLIDNIILTKVPVSKEFIEMPLDIGSNIADLLPKEEEKIDFSAIRENE